jgi:hypothetical protein
MAPDGRPITVRSKGAPSHCAAVAFGLTAGQVADTLNVLIEVGAGGRR